MLDIEESCDIVKEDIWCILADGRYSVSIEERCGLGCFKMQKVKISRWRSPKIGYYTKLSHCKRNWDFSCKIVAARNFFVFNGDFGGFQKCPFSGARKWDFKWENEKFARCHNFAGKIPIPFAMT